LHFIDDGNLYTFGSGGYGCLGQNEGDKNQVTPKLVDVAIGENHTLALTGFFFSFF